jgi:hypothetical protein
VINDVGAIRVGMIVEVIRELRAQALDGVPVDARAFFFVKNIG